MLRVGHLERFNPALVAVRDRIVAPRFIECHRLAPFKPRGTDVDVVLDLMIHDLDIILSLVGAPVAEVRANGAPVLTDQVDIANARIEFEDGCVANVTASRVTVTPMRKLRVFQPDCYVSIDFQLRAVAIAQADPRVTGPLPGIGFEQSSFPEGDSLEAETRGVHRCRARARSPRSDWPRRAPGAGARAPNLTSHSRRSRVRLRFTKMQGAGNDFIVLDGISQAIDLTSAQLARLADRHFGVGADQILLVERPRIPDVDFRYRIFNSDGGEVEQCGNGARCFVQFVRTKGLTTKRAIRVETLAGVISPRLEEDGQVTVDMGRPAFEPERVPFDTSGLQPRREALDALAARCCWADRRNRRALDGKPACGAARARY